MTEETRHISQEELERPEVLAELRGFMTKDDRGVLSLRTGTENVMFASGQDNLGLGFRLKTLGISDVVLRIVFDSVEDVDVLRRELNRIAKYLRVRDEIRN